MFDEAGVAPRTIIETATAVSAGEFVREGLGVALLNPFPIAAQLSIILEKLVPAKVG